MATISKRGRPTKFKEEYCEMLVDHMSQGLSFETFGAVVGIYKEALYNWVYKNENFANAKREGSLKSQLFWEKIGIDGTMGKINNFSTGTWIFNMKNRFGWSDKQDVALSSKESIKIQIKKDEDEL